MPKPPPGPDPNTALLQAILAELLKLNEQIKYLAEGFNLVYSSGVLGNPQKLRFTKEE